MIHPPSFRCRLISLGPEAIADSDVKQADVKLAVPPMAVIPTVTSDLGQSPSATKENSMSVNSLPLKGLLQTFRSA